MFKNLDPCKPYFYSVSLGLIVFGAALFSLGVVEWLFNYWSSYYFATPIIKVIGGVIILALGYIHLELELLRVQGGKK